MACTHLSLRFPSGLSRGLSTFIRATTPLSSCLYNHPPTTEARLQPSRHRPAAFVPRSMTTPGADNFSLPLSSFDDLRAYLEAHTSDDNIVSSIMLGDVMSMSTTEQTLEDIDHRFGLVSGLPVVDRDFKCMRVISTKPLMGDGDSNRHISNAGSAGCSVISDNLDQSDGDVHK